MASKTAWLSGQTAAALVGGAAAAVFASRVLPPLVAMVGGSARVAGGRDPLGGLIADHRRFSHLLTAMEQSRDDQPLRRTQLLFRLKRGLAAHAMAEEDVVYPLLDAEARAEQEARQLYGEHAEMKMLLYALEKTPKNEPGWADRAMALKRLVESHARHEEEIDFPRLRQTLSDPAKLRLARDIQREKSLLL